MWEKVFMVNVPSLLQLLFYFIDIVQGQLLYSKELKITIRYVCEITYMLEFNATLDGGDMFDSRDVNNYCANNNLSFDMSEC